VKAEIFALSTLGLTSVYQILACQGDFSAGRIQKSVGILALAWNRLHNHHIVDTFDYIPQLNYLIYEANGLSGHLVLLVGHPTAATLTVAFFYVC
jgi:hypothetical protein